MEQNHSLIPLIQILNGPDVKRAANNADENHANFYISSILDDDDVRKARFSVASTKVTFFY